ncbi:MAG: DinB family protein [Pyrinomonadaceae bacterium]|nr:DinB family protein [Pyrinomonadaceae bacterium]
MNTEERSKLIAKYNGGYSEVSDALKDFPAELLTARPLAGKWTACEIIHHLADSESTSAHRLRKLLVEDRPLIQGYDQDQFAIRLKYNERDPDPALDAFRAARATTAQVLALMSDDDWQRAGEHSESGRYTAETWLTVYAEHAHNHAAQIRRLRSTLNI